jgi:hypothetical protein
VLLARYVQRRRLWILLVKQGHATASRPVTPRAPVVHLWPTERCLLLLVEQLSLSIAHHLAEARIDLHGDVLADALAQHAENFEGRAASFPHTIRLHLRHLRTRTTQR